jgi:1-acyl-sn-glycerol-3-phosphate acyltransferase
MMTAMLAKLFARSLFALTGWTYNNRMPPGIRQSVMIAAPHTSKWDFLYARLAFVLMDIPVRITIENRYTKFPYGPFIRALGGIGIDRSPKKEGEERPSMVKAMVELFRKHKDFVMLVTPEGSRKLRTKWKTGFYQVALQANVPVALGYLDYQKKEAGVSKVVYPSGDMKKDFREIMAFYKNIAPCWPERFSVDLDYDS